MFMPLELNSEQELFFVNNSNNSNFNCNFFYDDLVFANNDFRDRVVNISNDLIFTQNKPFWNSSFYETETNLDGFLHKYKPFKYTVLGGHQDRIAKKIYLSAGKIFHSDVDVVVFSFPLNGNSSIADKLSAEYGEDFRNKGITSLTTKSLGDTSHYNCGSKSVINIISRLDDDVDYTEDGVLESSMHTIKSGLQVINKRINQDSKDIGFIKNDFIIGKYNDVNQQKLIFETFVKLVEDVFSNGLRNIVFFNI